MACEFEGVMVLEGILSEIEEADLVARLDSCEAGEPHSYSCLVFSLIVLFRYGFAFVEGCFFLDDLQSC